MYHTIPLASGEPSVSGDNTMASIQTTYAGNAAIAPGSGDQQSNFAAALVASTGSKSAGFTLSDFVIRYAAANGPLWPRRISVADLAYMVRSPSSARSRRRGSVHTFAHKAARGALETCAASGREEHGTCKATAPSTGDGIQRWRCDADANGPTDDRITRMRAADVVAIATSNVLAQCAYLRDRKHSGADMLETPGIVQRIDALTNVAGEAAGKALRSRIAGMGKATTARAPRMARKAPANVVPAMVPNSTPDETPESTE